MASLGRVLLLLVVAATVAAGRDSIVFRDADADVPRTKDAAAGGFASSEGGQGAVSHTFSAAQQGSAASHGAGFATAGAGVAASHSFSSSGASPVGSYSVSASFSHAAGPGASSASAASSSSFSRPNTFGQSSGFGGPDFGASLIPPEFIRSSRRRPKWYFDFLRNSAKNYGKRMNVATVVEEN